MSVLKVVSSNGVEEMFDITLTEDCRFSGRRFWFSGSRWKSLESVEFQFISGDEAEFGTRVCLLDDIRLRISSKPFHRGDANHDGQLDISDSIAVLGFLFLGGAAPACAEAAEGNNDGQLDVSDGIFLLNFLFNGGKAPPPPGPPSDACGFDALEPEGFLGCDSYKTCS